MLCRIEALNFRCLRDIQCPLDRFQILIGPNGTGKTTLLDTIAFISDLLNLGLEEALGKRSPNALDLSWKRRGGRLELAVEAEIPALLRQRIENPDFVRCRYEVAIGREDDEDSIVGERVVLLQNASIASLPPAFFPSASPPRETLSIPERQRTARTTIKKRPDGKANFYPEVGGKYKPVFHLGATKSALANLPEDEAAFPVSTWLKETLRDHVEAVTLNSLALRKPSPPGKGRRFMPDGSNLPWLIATLAENHPDRLKEWVRHLATGIPDIEEVGTFLREEDKHRYIVVRFRGGFEIPSWLLSDGTLRLMALTLPAYLPEFRGIYMIEEPENGVHPRAVETMFQAIRSVYDAQILLATHSPVVLAAADTQEILCFAKTPEGETAVVRGNEHPMLREWKGTPNLGALYAGGVLD